MRCLLPLLALLLAGSASAQEFQNAFPNLTFSGPIVDIQAPADGSNRLFVAEQRGTVRVFMNDASSTQTGLFLDLRPLVSTAGSSEKGMSGLAFDPGYAQNGYLYVSYTADNPLRLDVVRYQVSAANPNQADASSAAPVLSVPLPDDEHHAGQLQFGPDGYLYLSLGDGVFSFFGQPDPFGNGQDPTTLLSSLLRLDVRGTGLPLDCAAGTGLATVPAGNPLSDGLGGVCDEVWAYGFRNPWRFSFGPDGRLWLGDVGQNSREEVNLVEAGGNYGWKTYEGTQCFDAPCDPSGITFPIREYPHTFSANGGFSVIGGYVYRGNTCAALLGRYVYGDFITTNLWSLTSDGTTADNDVLDDFSGLAVTTFGEDEQGELFLGDSDGNTLQRLDCAQPVTVSAAPVGSTTIPAGGGPVTFDVTLSNTTASAQTFQAWATANLSNGAERTVVAPVSVRLPAGFSVTRRVSLGVPGFAPGGVSTLVVKVGAFPDAASSADLFTATKAGAAARGVAAQAASAEWQVEGFGFDAGEAPGARAAGEPAAAWAESTAQVALSAFPTPFAGQTSVHYRLAEAGALRLAVFDVLGREVALLAEGRAEAGAHAAVFDARGLPSGAYVVRLEAGGTVETRTVTRLR